MKLTFRRGVLVRRQQRRRPSSSEHASDVLNTLRWVHRITPSSGREPNKAQRAGRGPNPQPKTGMR
eukprot:scaffold95603_cov35-Phaeocystis_antarctica.AAC.3